MRLLSLLLLTFACAHSQPAPQAGRSQMEFEPDPVVEEAPAPARNVRWVAHRPPHYKFVGKVRGTAPSDDFVEGAKVARKKLTQKAEALGADVVKIDRLDPGTHGRVLIAGRAYRLAD